MQRSERRKKGLYIMYYECNSNWQAILRGYGILDHVEPPSEREIAKRQNDSPGSTLDQVLMAYANAHATGPTLED
jgi:hypothetical protein